MEGSSTLLEMPFWIDIDGLQLRPTCQHPEIPIAISRAYIQQLMVGNTHFRKQ